MVRDTKLTPVGGVDAFPLSPMQQGMLFHRLQGGSAGVDVEQVICELHEPVHAARFEQAWREVVDRHTALRTGFQWDDGGEPRQIVFAPSEVRLNLHHVEFGSEQEARLGLEEYLIADRREGFPTLNPPLLRVALLRGGPERFWFVTTYHHLALDARSMTIMFREALEIHDALVQGRPLQLPPARPYRPYIDWLQTLHLPRAEKFWREHLAGFTSPTLLPIARPTGSDHEHGEAAGELAFRLPESITTQLRAVAQKHEVTLNTLVQGAWSVVLSRYAGEEDVVFGAVRACRKIPVEGANSIIGLLINTVPVRVRATAGVAIDVWLRELRQQWIALRDYEHTPLMKIQQWSDVTPGQPLFHTILSYQEPAWDAALTELGGPWARRHFDIRAQPNYPLALEVLAGTGLTVKFIYNRARFNDDAVARLAGHVRVVIEALASGQFATVGELPLLSPREREQLLVDWNPRSTPYPRTTCVHTCVETHAKASPARIAVTDPANALTYGELNARANRLAHRLKAGGVGPDTLVAVCMDRSAEMIVAWLGVLKAGGAFVPVDPAYPKDRLAFHIQDSGAPVLLVQPRLRATLPALPPGVAVIEIPADGSGFAEDSDENPPLAATAENLAYVIYTSGSTGQPKGVEIEHRALMNLVTWHQQAYDITSGDRATHLASPAFDASVWEIWPYLAAGARVHIPDEETRLAPSLLWRWMAEKKITVSFMPTPLAEAAMNEAWPAELALRAVLTGGDKLKRRPPKNFPCALINHYGPTESTVVATCIAVPPGDAEAGTPTIGRPIANTQVYVLDRQLRPVPVGVPGELYIGGESLARGYHRRPELTEERFVSVRFVSRSAGSLPAASEHGQADRATSRLYRTGDLVRWTATGELEFVGRLDSQVKVRGCRIELGEVEATIQLHPLVRESIVLARNDDRGQTQIVAYVVSHGTRGNTAGGAGALSEAGVIEFLRAKLPSYMVPAAVVVLDTWPLTPNGKIDRNALPTPGGRLSESRAPFAAPSTPVQLTIAKIWTDVLNAPEVGLADNFFDLGGHSLLAAQVVSRVNAALQARVTVRALFDHPTLMGFAREVEQRLETYPSNCVPLNRVKRRAPRAEMELVQPN